MCQPRCHQGRGPRQRPGRRAGLLAGAGGASDAADGRAGSFGWPGARSGNHIILVKEGRSATLSRTTRFTGDRHACSESPVREQPGLGRRDDRARARLLRAPVAAAGAAVPVDRLLGQPGARQPDRRPAARRDVRPSQRRQRGGAHRPELPVGHPVRGGGAPRRAHHRLRALRLRRRPGGPARRETGADRQLAAARPGRAAQAPAATRRAWRARRSGTTACAS